MQYLSFAFVIFVILVWGLYYVFPRKHRWIVLLVASLIFYLSYDKRYVFFLMFVAITTFFGAKFGRNKRRNKENLILCVLANTCLWFVMKWLPGCWNWVDSIGKVLFEDFQLPTFSIIAPIGISYYALLAISYIIDVYKKRIKPENNFGKYLLYLAYFPTIVQGPISKYEQMREQLTIGENVDYSVFRKSLLLILIGLTKKMVIADRIAIWANYCFDNYSDLQGIILYVGALCYSIQLYMDFSGCVDMCRGVSGLFGIKLMDNFKAPYFSTSIKEFWGKWHISLSTWLKDYVYIPLGGNRKGKIRKYINIFITFLVSGVWHGSGLTYIVWGILHAMYQIVGDVSNDIRRKVKNLLGIEENSLSDRVYRTIITFNLTLFAWIFFRAGRLLNAVDYIKRMFSSINLWTLFDGSLFSQGIQFSEFIVLIINICFIVFVDWLKVKSEKDVENYVLESHTLVRWCCYLVLVFNIILFGAYGTGYDASGFLYGGY